MKTPLRTRILAAVLAGATLFGGAFVGGLVAGGESASAQESPTETPTPDADTRPDRATRIEERLNQAIESGRITAEEADEIRAKAADREARAQELRDATPEERAAALEDRLNAAIESGRITPEEADEIRAKIAEGQGRFQERRGDRQAARAEKAGQLADALGVTTDELKAAFQDGQSIADIAASAGADLDAIAADMIAAATARIDQALADGRIDSEKASEIQAGLEEKILARLNGERPERGGPGN
ncbi:MAG: hypothetical protein AAF567_22655 [Actinomycetota bacterium]